MRPLLAGIIGFTFALGTAFAAPRPNVKPKPAPAMQRAPFVTDEGFVYLPKGAFNVGRNRPVTTSAKLDFNYRNWFTDGDKSSDRFLELEGGRQWVQLDFQSSFLIHGIRLWHDCRVRNVYRDVVIQLSDDAAFKKSVRTVFNNDNDNSSGLGRGKNREYSESDQGQWIPIQAQTARYIRLYSNGSTFDRINRYIEIEVWGSLLPGMMVAPFKLPAHQYHAGPYLEPKYTTAIYYSNLPRGVIAVPQGSANVALKKPVSSSDTEPLVGNLAMITDGYKECTEGSYVELGPGPQWVQIDLQNIYDIHGVLLWHMWFDYSHRRAYRDVIIQLADDAEFKTNVRTVFNNDQDNSSGLGKGKDREFLQDRDGQWIPINHQRARYIRLYSNGSSRGQWNEYSEVEVWATDVKPKSQPEKPTHHKQ